MTACGGCGSDNRDGARFCRQCGEPLPAACPGCGADVGAGDRLVWGLSTYAELAEGREEFEAALAHGEEALRIADDTANLANRVIALRAIGAASLGLGRFDDAITALGRGISEARDRRVGLFEEGMLLTHLALAHLGAGRGSEALAAAGEAVSVARRQGTRTVESKALLNQARVGRALGLPHPEVQDQLDGALSLARQTGAAAYEAEIPSG